MLRLRSMLSAIAHPDHITTQSPKFGIHPVLPGLVSYSQGFGNGCERLLVSATAMMDFRQRTQEYRAQCSCLKFFSQCLADCGLFHSPIIIAECSNRSGLKRCAPRSVVRKALFTTYRH